MYAVVKTGGKQYKVSVGEKLKVEQIPAELDSQIELTEVLLFAAGESVLLTIFRQRKLYIVCRRFLRPRTYSTP